MKATSQRCSNRTQHPKIAPWTVFNPEFESCFKAVFLFQSPCSCYHIIHEFLFFFLFSYLLTRNANERSPRPLSNTATDSLARWESLAHFINSVQHQWELLLNPWDFYAHGDLAFPYQWISASLYFHVRGTDGKHGVCFPICVRVFLRRSPFSPSYSSETQETASSYQMMIWRFPAG